jgi:hypothetical protein
MLIGVKSIAVALVALAAGALTLRAGISLEHTDVAGSPAMEHRC